jgi:hypothetical protein
MNECLGQWLGDTPPFRARKTFSRVFINPAHVFSAHLLLTALRIQDEFF